MDCIKRQPLREKSNDITTNNPVSDSAHHQLQIREGVSGTSKKTAATSKLLLLNSATLKPSPTVADNTQHPVKDSSLESSFSFVFGGKEKSTWSSNAFTVAARRADNASDLTHNRRRSPSPGSLRSGGDLDVSSLRHGTDNHVDLFDCGDGPTCIPTPPPPVACTLVAFEPGALGLELEAVVDSRGRRLGCRVFRVSPNGQAARHGSVHPGDALVVLDGVDVLSEPFDSITRALLERQDQHRLIGFMGAAAVASPSRSGDATENLRPTTRRSTRSVAIVGSTSLASRDDTHGSAVHAVRQQCRDLGPIATEAPGMDSEEDRRQGRRRVRPAAGRPSAQLEDVSNITASEGSGRYARDSGYLVREESITIPKAPSSPSLLGSECVDVADVKDPTAEPADTGRSPLTRGDREDLDDLLEDRQDEERLPSPSASNPRGKQRGGRDLDGASCQDTESLQNSPESSMAMRRPAPIPSREGPREESLRCGLRGALEDKTILSAERAWFLEELRRAREATLDREGALAEQNVQNDVLKMELKALEAELRRARQELGASEASRRELSEAAKRDLARRDRDASDLSSQLHRERVARGQDVEKAAAAAARAADKAAKRAAAAGQVATAEAKRRADAAEARAAEAERKRVGSEAAARKAAVVAEAALKRERECRDTEVRARDKEITSLTSRVQGAEARCRKISEDKEAQMRELEEAAVRSLELAERRKSESEDKAAALSVKIKDKEAKVRQACAARMKEVEERQAEELRKLKEAFEGSQTALGEARVHAEAEAVGLSSQLEEKSRKISLALSQLRTTEQRARMLETGARAARQRAEASARKEEELSKRLAVLETERACQDVTVTTLRTQLQEVRRGVATGEAAMRESARIRSMLEDALDTSRGQRGLPPVQGECVIRDREGVETTADKGGADETERHCSLGELADALRRRLERAEDEVDNLRDALSTARAEKETLRRRDEDAAELRSILRQKKGLSAEITRGLETARTRAERAEREVERMRAEVASSRDQLERTQRLLREEKARAELELLPRLEDLERSLADKRQIPLEEALASAEEERVDVLERLTRKDGELVTMSDARRVDYTLRQVKSQLESTSAELKAVKAMLLQGSDQQLPRQRGACMLMAVVLHRHWARSAAAAIALSRWQRFTREEMLASARHRPSVTGDEVAGEPEVDAQGVAGLGRKAREPALPTAGAKILDESRLMNSKAPHGDTRLQICGARALLGLLEEWATRQSWRAFRRLQFSRSSYLLRGDACPVPRHLDKNGSRAWLPPRQTWDSACSAGDREQPSTDHDERFALVPSISVLGPRSEQRSLRDREALTPRSRERSQRRPGRSTQHSPPPKSPASAFAHGQLIESTVLGVSNGSDLSLVSAASSEPRYHCLRDDSSSSEWGEPSRALDGDSFLDISTTHDWIDGDKATVDQGAGGGDGSVASSSCGGVPDAELRGGVDGDASWWAVSDESST